MAIPLENALNNFFKDRKGYLLLSNVQDTPRIEFYFDHPDPSKRNRKAPKIIRPNRRTVKNRDLALKCVIFLVQNYSDGQIPPKKAILHEQTNEALGAKVPTKIFNEACARVFPRKRGRPPINK